MSISFSRRGDAPTPKKLGSSLKSASRARDQGRCGRTGGGRRAGGGRGGAGPRESGRAAGGGRGGGGGGRYVEGEFRLGLWGGRVRNLQLVNDRRGGIDEVVS